jgi:hypothetical protein
MRLRRTRALGIPVLAVMLAAACATERPLSAALLPESALPPGLQYRQIDEFPDLSQAFANTTVRPPDCDSPEVLNPYGDPARLQAAVYVGTGRSGMLTVGLVRGPRDLDLSRPRRTLQRCSNLTIRTPDVSITAQLERVAAPDVDADDVLAYRQTLNGPEGSGQAQQTLFLAAVDDGVVVTVTGSAGDGDMTLFTDLLRRSLQRKEEVLG